MRGAPGPARCDDARAASESGQMKAGNKLSVAFRRARIRRIGIRSGKPLQPAPQKGPRLQLVVSNTPAPKS